MFIHYLHTHILPKKPPCSIAIKQQSSDRFLGDRPLTAGCTWLTQTPNLYLHCQNICPDSKKLTTWQLPSQQCVVHFLLLTIATEFAKNKYSCFIKNTRLRRCLSPVSECFSTLDPFQFCWHFTLFQNRCISDAQNTCFVEMMLSDQIVEISRHLLQSSCPWKWCHCVLCYLVWHPTCTQQGPA